LSCPTCNGALGILARDPSYSLWLCDRCGTVVRIYRSGDKNDVYVPKLVERLRVIEKELPNVAFITLWVKSGVEESINPPGERTYAKLMAEALAGK
jgi:hypothetical protein